MDDDKTDSYDRKPPVQSVVEAKLTNNLQSVYERAYLKRYGIKPLYEDQEDLSIFKWLFFKTGIERGHQLIERYLELSGSAPNDDWYLRNGHSLKVFKKNLHIINANLGSRGRPKSKMTVQLFFHCDSCWKRFEFKYDAAISLDTAWVKCPKCLLNNEPWRYPTREEYYLNHSAFQPRTMNQEPITFIKNGISSYDKTFPTFEPYPNRELLDYELP